MNNILPFKPDQAEAEEQQRRFKRIVDLDVSYGKHPDKAQNSAYKYLVHCEMSCRPVHSLPGSCFACGEGDHEHDLLRPYKFFCAVGPSAVWLHRSCFLDWD